MNESETGQAPVRVVQVEVPDRAQGEELFGPGMGAPRCVVVFRNMLPVPAEATLRSVTRHGLVLSFAPAEGGEHNALLVPWGQVSYLKLAAD